MPFQQYGYVNARRGSTFSAYVLTTPDEFSSAEYKLLAGQRTSCLIPCVPSHYNGYQKLTYFVDGLVPLPRCVYDMNAKEFVVVVANLLDQILHIENNGLLEVCKLDISTDAFYVNPQDCSVGIVYLPVMHRVCADSSVNAFNVFCSSIFGLMSQYSQLQTLIQPLASFANSSAGRFDAFLGKLRASYDTYATPVDSYTLQSDSDVGDSGLFPPTPQTGATNSAATYVLSGTAGDKKIRFQVSQGQPPVVVGRNHHGVSVLVEGVPTVSGKHCELSATVRGLFVRDLGSRNGTFVNGARLSPQQSAQLKSGDELGVASVLLKVRRA